MLKDVLLEIYIRDLNKLKNEIGRYESDEDLWKVAGEISNSGGNLCQHLVGNLNHYVGALLGNSGYERHRDAEFSAQNASRAALIESIEQTIKVVKGALENFSAEDFEKDYPVEKHEKVVKTDFMLLHLLTHFNYHLGQINYHRRLIQQIVSK